MKATGIVRRVDDLGRIVIPKVARRELGITEGTPMELFIEKDTVIFKKYCEENSPSDTTENFKVETSDGTGYILTCKDGIYSVADNYGHIICEFIR